MTALIQAPGTPGPPGPTGPTGPDAGPSGVGIVGDGPGVAALFSGGHINTPYSHAAVGALSMLIAVYQSASQSANDARIMTDGDPQNESGGSELGYGVSVANGQQMQWVLYTSSNGKVVVTDPETWGSYANEWTWFLGTWDGTTAILYRQGTNVASAGASGTCATPGGVTLKIAGLDSGGNNPFDGRLAHAAFWAGTALSAATATAIVNEAASTTEADMESYIQSLAPTVYWPLQDTSGTTAVALTGSADDGTYTGSYSLGAAGPILGLTPLNTNPPATETVTMTSGTAWQNTGLGDVLVTLPVTYNPTSTADATLAVGVGPTATPTQVTEESAPATAPTGVIRTTTLYVPASWYVLATVTNATLGTATVQPV